MNILVINCSFALEYSYLNEDEAWFVKEIMKNTGTMTDTREAITDFNNQLSIVIWVKKLIQERPTIVSTIYTSQATGEEGVTGDDSIMEAATPSTSQ